MAKGSVIKAIKAKPNAKGKTSNLPLTCTCTKCEEDFLVSYPIKYELNKVVYNRKCAGHFLNPPQVVPNGRNHKMTHLLEQLNLI